MSEGLLARCQKRARPLGHVQIAPQAAEELQNGLRFRFSDGLHHLLSGGIKYCRRNRCLMNFQPNLFGVIHEGAPCR